MESSSVLVTVQQYTTQSPSATHCPARGQDWGPACQLQGFGGVGGGGGGGGGAGTFSTINPPHSSSQSTQALALTGSYIYYKYSSFALRL